MYSLFVFFISLSFSFFCYSNTYDILVEKQIISQGSKPALHLGCGSNHLENYVNIDFPLDNHPVQSISGADYFDDITNIKFPKDSVSSIRNHHFFEHFNRNQALAMLCAWHLWLCKEGSLIIETPDFERAIKRLLKTTNYVTQQQILRHIFGSHEAFWAIHCDGWYKEKFIRILSQLGFAIEHIDQTNWLMTDNIIVYARKKEHLDLNSLKKIAKDILKQSLIDDTETKMYEVFCNDFEASLKRMILND